MEDKKILFVLFDESYTAELNTWQAIENSQGRDGLSEFVVSRGTLLGDYISYIDEQLDAITCNIAIQDNQVVGFICHSKPELNHAHVEIMGVNPNYRGQGIARNMLREFKTIMTEQGNDKVTLEVKKENTSGISSFSKVGTPSTKQSKDSYIGFEL